ncbi:MAG TPA: acylphosphatase [Gammaproteobacteria bacterium]|jgi:acylphosphatase
MGAKRCFVSGKVQGVFYRASTAERARALGLTGHAKNLPDGRVEVLACGDEAKVQALIDWLWQGPPAAKVQGVEVQDADAAQAPRDFSTR